MADKFDWDKYEEAPAENEEQSFDWSKFTESKEPIKLEGQALPEKRDLILPETEGFSPEAEMAKTHGGMAEAALRGGAQGATMGFADELEAALKAGSISNEEYMRLRDEARAEYQASQEAYPKTYGAGMIGGIVAPNLLTLGGAGAVPTAARAVTTPASALLRSLAPAAKGLGQVAATTAAGTADTALMAGAAAAGFAEGDKLQAAKEAATDLKTLALGAGLTGAAASVPYAIEKGKQLGTFLKENVPAVESAAEAYRIKKATGQDVIGKEAAERAIKQTGELSEDISKEMLAGFSKQEAEFKKQLIKTANTALKLQQRAKGQVGNRIGETVQGVLESGDSMYISSTLDDIMDDVARQVEAGNIEESKVKGLMEQLRKLKQTAPAPALTAQETKVMAQSPQISMFEETPSEIIKRSAKVGGKDVTLEELQALRERAGLVL